jgi:hypothetical protein
MTGVACKIRASKTRARADYEHDYEHEHEKNHEHEIDYEHERREPLPVGVRLNGSSGAFRSPYAFIACSRNRSVALYADVSFPEMKSASGGNR